MKQVEQAHLEVVQQVSTGDFGAADLLLHQVLWRQQRWDQLHQLLLKVLINICRAHTHGDQCVAVTQKPPSEV